MRAYVFVVAAQYFGRTNDAGTWTEKDVQPGDYEVTIWHPLSRSLKPVLQQALRIDATGPKVTLRASAPLQLRAESQVPANWDAY